MRSAITCSTPRTSPPSWLHLGAVGHPVQLPLGSTGVVARLDDDDVGIQALHVLVDLSDPAVLGVQGAGAGAARMSHGDTGGFEPAWNCSIPWPTTESLTRRIVSTIGVAGYGARPDIRFDLLGEHLRRSVGGGRDLLSLEIGLGRGADRDGDDHDGHRPRPRSVRPATVAAR